MDWNKADRGEETRTDRTDKSRLKQAWTDYGTQKVFFISKFNLTKLRTESWPQILTHQLNGQRSDTGQFLFLYSEFQILIHELFESQLDQLEVTSSRSRLFGLLDSPGNRQVTALYQTTATAISPTHIYKHKSKQFWLQLNRYCWLHSLDKTT